MREKQTSFKLHEFSGTWHEIGQQYGEECREEIKDMHAYWENALSAVMPDKTMDEIVEKSAIFAEPIKTYAPEFMDEIEGIAEGAGISANEALFHQGSFEMDVAGPLYIGGCTSFAASGKATKDGKTIAGQHFDWFDGAAMVMMKLKPKDGPAILGTSIAGQLLQFGINELGVAHYANVLCWPKSVVGVPAVVSAQKALLSKNVPDALRCITQCQNAIALNHLIAGKDGDILDVEATPDKCGILLPDRDIMTHSNHFLTHFLQDRDLADQTSFPDTFLRQYRLKQLMEDRYGEIDVEVMMELLTDHRGYPDSICRHCDETGPEYEKFRTLISIISLPAEGKMWVSPQPCEYPYEMFSL